MIHSVVLVRIAASHRVRFSQRCVSELLVWTQCEPKKKIQFGNWIQVNQKHSFMYILTHSMSKRTLNYQFTTWKIQVQYLSCKYKNCRGRFQGLLNLEYVLCGLPIILQSETCQQIIAKKDQWYFQGFLLVEGLEIPFVVSVLFCQKLVIGFFQLQGVSYRYDLK